MRNIQFVGSHSSTWLFVPGFVCLFAHLLLAFPICFWA